MAKGWKIEGLTVEQPIAERARRIIITKFREAWSYRAEVITSEEIETIHNMRVSLRRLWAAVTTFGQCFWHEPNFTRLAKRTRKLAAKLGRVRDRDVLIEILTREAANQTNPDMRAAADQIIAGWQRQRAKARQKLLKYLDKLARQQFDLEFLNFFETIVPTSIVAPGELFAGALDNFYAHDLQGNYQDVEALHELRIAAKRLRYSLEFFEFCSNRRLPSYLKSMRLLQELLGDIHDCDVMIALITKRQVKFTVEQAALASGCAVLINDFATQRASLVEQFDEIWQRSFRRGFRARLTRILHSPIG